MNISYQVGDHVIWNYIIKDGARHLHEKVPAVVLNTKGKWIQIEVSRPGKGPLTRTVPPVQLEFPSG